jgi:hypothetical protein
VSVHGEYHRTLRAVLFRLTEAGDAIEPSWIEAFSRAQVDDSRDLSTAARTALALVTRLEHTLGAAGEAGCASTDAAGSTTARMSPLRDACHHLRAHCRAILGLGSED